MKRNIASALFLVAFVSSTANALAAIEYLKLETENKEMDVTKQMVIQFVTRGYKNVPDWAKLSRLIRQKILEKGYTYQNVENVAEEAAIEAGMRR